MISKLKVPIILVVSILIIDQTLKIWVKTNLQLYESIEIFGKRGLIYFTENPGMAFGFSFGGEWGKLSLTIFRIIASIGIGWYIYDLARKNAPKGLLISFALIFAGAVGNIIDSAFYGLIFNGSENQIAEIFPAGGGYGRFLHGKVVDMFYFPLIEGRFPQQLPLWGGQSFTFFSPVFNVADSAITVGVALILIFHRRFFKHQVKQKQEVGENTTEVINS